MFGLISPDIFFLWKLYWEVKPSLTTNTAIKIIENNC